MTYAWLKLLHVLSVVVFVGNITTGLFWAARAHRSGDWALIATTFDGIIRSDRLFTAPGVIGIVASGFALAIVAGLPILGTSWIFWPIVLFSISGIVFGVWVAPLQRQILAKARAAEAASRPDDEYRRLYRRWEGWGLLALVTPLLALVIMVLKPALPGLGG